MRKVSTFLARLEMSGPGDLSSGDLRRSSRVRAEEVHGGYISENIREFSSSRTIDPAAVIFVARA